MVEPAWRGQTSEKMEGVNMAEKGVGFVGSGRIARIMMGGWSRAERVPPLIVVSDADETAIARLRRSHPQVETAGHDNRVPASQEVVILSVPPTAIEQVAPQIAPALRPNAIVVSPVPKLPISRLSQLLGGFDRIARVIPNAPSIVCAGYNPLAFSSSLGEADRQAVTELWSPLGDCPVVPEEVLNAYIVLTARGPAYFWFQFYELLRLAQSAGLTREQACDGLQKMLAGAVCTMSQSGLGEEAVKDLIPMNPLGPAECTVTELYRSTAAGVVPAMQSRNR